jgi:hypothetical protein
VSETDEAREDRVRQVAESKGFKLQRWGEGTSITALEYSLIAKRNNAIVVDHRQGLDFIESYLAGLTDED